MEKRLWNKTALITGGARGLGAAIARRFAEQGCRVVVTDRNAEGAAEVARTIDGVAMALDVTDSRQVHATFERVARELGTLDILINNAGISGLEGKSEAEVAERRAIMLQQAEELAQHGRVTTHHTATLELSDQEWRAMIDVHLTGTFYCSRSALRLMAAQESGSIINLGSILGIAGAAGAVAYSAAKGGILTFTRALAREVVTRGIRVNAIAPGWIDTDMTAPLGEARALIAASIPMARFGEPDDIAWAAVYLASDEAKYVTGQVLSPNGGWYMGQ